MALSARSSLSPIPDKKYRIIIVFLLVAVVAFVAVLTWLGMTGKFGQGNNPTPLTMSPTQCFRKTPLLQLAGDDAKDGDYFGDSVSVFGGWAIVGAPYSNNVKGRAYLYKRVLGAWINWRTIQASDGSDGDYFGESVSINEKIVVVGAPARDNENAPASGAVYLFTRPGENGDRKLQGETWTEDKILTASDMASDDYFGDSVDISGDTLLVGAQVLGGC